MLKLMAPVLGSIWFTKWLRWLIKYFCRFPNLRHWGWEKEKVAGFYLQYSITTKSSLFFRLVVQAPRRLTILRCLWKKKSVLRAWLSWLPSQVHHYLELSHECFQVGDVSCQLHHLDGNHCFFPPRLDPESISLHHLGRERESQYPGRNPPCKRAD